MAGFLEAYGVADAHREKVTRWIVIAVLLAVIAAFALYFVLRTWPAKRQISVFLDDLRRHDYQAAYRDWGCGQPCKDYPLPKFLEDWGPKSEFGNAAAARIRRSAFCNTGVIVTVTSPGGGDVPLWYQRSDGTLGFAPWPICTAHIPVPGSVPAR